MEKTQKQAGTNKRMMNGVLAVVGILVLIGVGVWYYMDWQAAHYLSTDNAKVSATLYTVTPVAAGKLEKLKIAQGVTVLQDDIIARIENGPDIKAPVTGQIVKCDVVLGQIVTPATAVAVLADASGAYIGANIEETNIRKITENQQVDVKLDAYPGKVFLGHIDSIDQVTQAALRGNVTSLTTSGTYTKVTQLIPVKIVLDDDIPLEDIIGTNATVTIHLK